MSAVLGVVGPAVMPDSVDAAALAVEETPSEVAAMESGDSFRILVTDSICSTVPDWLVLLVSLTRPGVFGRCARGPAPGLSLEGGARCISRCSSMKRLTGPSPLKP